MIARLLDKFNIHSKEDFWKFVWQFVKFGLVGVSNTLISLAVYYAVVLLFGVEHYILANTLGFVISVINAYIWNSKFVFQKKDRKHGKSFVKVFVSYGSTFLLGTGFLFVLVHYWNVSEMIAPIINLLLTIPLNFLLNKFWAFK